MPTVDRFKGQTQEDNVPMLRTFRRAGWVKEAHYRRSQSLESGGTPRRERAPHLDVSPRAQCEDDATANFSRSVRVKASI